MNTAQKMPTFSKLPTGPNSTPFDPDDASTSSSTQGPLSDDKPLLESRMDAEAREPPAAEEPEPSDAEESAPMDRSSSDDKPLLESRMDAEDRG